MFHSQSKIVVVGTSGSGKSFVARKLSEKFGIKRIELDALHWEPNWVEAPLEVFRERIAHAIAEAGGGWVVDGNYNKARDLIWPKADTIIWLDYPFPLVFWQAFTRTIKRAVRRETLWSGNRESLRKAFFAKDSILLWVIQTHKKNAARYEVCAKEHWRNHRLLRVKTKNDLKKILGA